jgi:hypothetical protein
MRQFLLYQIIKLSLFSTILILASSCKKDDKDIDKLVLLTNSSWLGEVKTEDFDYDANNRLINQSPYETPEGQLRLMSLSKDKKAIIKYECDKTNCGGDQYNGKWEVVDNKLKVSINREELNTLADAILIEGEILTINTSELIIEIIFLNPTASIPKKLRRITYISDK